MAIKFDVPSLYNKKIAEEGIDFRIEKNDKYFGTFTLRYSDPYSKKSALELKRLQKKYAKEIRTKKFDDFYMLAVGLCHFNLIGWKDIKAGGKPVEFSIENALEYFSLEETYWLLMHLTKIAEEPAHFEDDGMPITFDKAVTEKN